MPENHGIKGGREGDAGRQLKRMGRGRGGINFERSVPLPELTCSQFPKFIGNGLFIVSNWGRWISAALTLLPQLKIPPRPAPSASCFSLATVFVAFSILAHILIR